MIKDWSVEDIQKQISKISFAESDPRMDGFVTWGCKRDLYEILFSVQDALSKCSTYSVEEDYLKQREKV